MFKKTKKLSLQKMTEAMIMAAVMSSSVYGYAAPAPLELPVLQTGDGYNADIAANKVSVDESKRNQGILNIQQADNANVAQIDWNSFNIGSNATVNVKQMISTQTLINNVVGNKMSEIYGKINASGNIVLINPKGAVFGGNAQVNVGGLSVYATQTTGLDGYGNAKVDPNNILQGNITVKDNAQIHVGIGYAISQLSNLGISADKYTLGQVAWDSPQGKLRLVAAGDVLIDGTSGSPELVAVGSVSNTGEKDVGVEQITQFNQATPNKTGVMIRADADADDWGKVTINGAAQTKFAGSVDIFSNPEITGIATTQDGIEYNKKNYQDSNFGANGGYSGTGAATGVNNTVWSGARNETLKDAQDAGHITVASPDPGSKVTDYMLVNNIAQLQDIEAAVVDGKGGNLEGRYALGRTVSGTSDGTSVIKDGVIYIANKDTQGNLVKTIKSTDTNSVFVDAESKATGNASAVVGKVVTIDGKDYTVSMTADGSSISKTQGSTSVTYSNTNGTEDGGNVTGTITSSGGKTYTVNENANTATTNNGSTIVNANSKTVSENGAVYTADTTNNTIIKDGYTANTQYETVSKDGYTANTTNNTITGVGYTANTSDTTISKDGYTANTTATTISKDGYVANTTDKTIAKDGYTADTENKTIAKGDYTANTQSGTLTKGDDTYSTSGTATIGGKDYTYADGKISSGEYSSDATTISKGDYSYNGSDFMKGTETVVVTDDNNISIGSTAYQTYTDEGISYIKVNDVSYEVTSSEGQAALAIFNEAQTTTAGLNANRSAYTSAFTTYGTYKSTYGTYASTYSTYAFTYSTYASTYGTYADTYNTYATAYGDMAAKYTDYAGKYNSYQKAYNDFVAGNNAFNNFETVANQNRETYTELVQTAAQQYNTIGHMSATNPPVKLGTINASTWNGGKGFNPIGTTNGEGTAIQESGTPFSGYFTGYNGIGSAGVTGLVINRADEDNVGLFSKVTGTVHDLGVSGHVEGHENVGMVAGNVTGTLSWVGSGGTVKGVENVGGLAGIAGSSSKKAAISSSSNGASVTADKAFDYYNDLSKGPDPDLDHGTANASKTGGIAGYVVDAEISNVRNSGQVVGQDQVGGIVGQIDKGSIHGSDEFTLTYNNSKVIGYSDVGGIAGKVDAKNLGDVKIKQVFNTNESSILDSQNEVESGQSVTTPSENGKITGVTDVGGIVGHNKNGKIETVYNAGNVDGAISVGGIVGHLESGTIEHTYNADNNTVMREQLSDAAKAALDGYTTEQDGIDGKTLYAYNEAQTTYNSFFVEKNGVKTYYYFIPASGELKQGAPGVYVTLNDLEHPIVYGDQLKNIAPEKDRVYFNRLAYKDANISGNTNVGGLVGQADSGTIKNSYNAGTVKSSNGTVVSEGTHGALVGTINTTNTQVTDSFYVTGTVGGNAKDFSGQYTSDSTTKDLAAFGNLPITGTVPSANGVTKYQQGTNISVYSGNFNAMSSAAALKEVQGTNQTWAHTNSAQNENWITYELSTLPLLQEFLMDETLTRTFMYDGNTHNLTTIDIENLYGMAGFDDIYGGRDVYGGQKYEYETDEKGVNHSKYTFDNTNMWSPQHAFKTREDAHVMITQAPMQVKITGERVYGQHNLQGYYVYAPANGNNQDSGNDKYYVINGTSYTDIKANELATLQNLGVISESEKSSITVSELTTRIAGLTDQDTKAAAEKELANINAIKGAVEDLGYYTFAATDTVAKIQTEAGKITNSNNAFQNKVYANGNQLATITGLVNERELVDKVLTGLIANTVNGTSGTGLYDNQDKNIQNSVGTKNFNGNNYSGIENVHRVDKTGADVGFSTYDYDITYNGNLKIKKADLYYTYDGEKEYGKESNYDTTGKITLVGKDENTNTDSANGLLKSFDAGKVVGSGLTITSLKNNKVLACIDGVEIDPAATIITSDGYIQYTLKKGTETETIKVKQSDGTVRNDTKGWAKLVLNPDQDGYVDGNIYHVKVKDGDVANTKVVDSYQVLWTNITANNALSNYNLIFAGEQGKTENGVLVNGRVLTTTHAERVEGVEYLDNVVRAETTGKPSATQVKVARSTQTITPKEIKVIAQGTREYGSLMNQLNVPTINSTLTANRWNLSVGETATFDSADGIINKDKVKSELNNVEDHTTDNSIATKIGSNTWVKDYNLSKSDEKQNKGANVRDGLITDSLVDFTDYYNKDGNGKFTSFKTDKADQDIFVSDKKYDYIAVLDGDHHDLNITKANLTIDIKGGKTYGEATGTGAANASTMTGAGESGHLVTVNSDGYSGTVDAIQYQYIISGLKHADETIGGLGNTAQGSYGTSQTIGLNVAQSVAGTNGNVSGSITKGTSGMTITGGHEGVLSVNFGTENPVTTTSDAFDAGNYNITTTSHLAVDKRIVQVDTDASRTYGATGNLDTKYKETTAASVAAAQQVGGNVKLFTAKSADGTKDYTELLTGLTDEQKAAWVNAQTGLINKNSAGLSTADKSYAGLDVKYDQSNNVASYMDDNNNDKDYSKTGAPLANFVETTFNAQNGKNYKAVNGVETLKVNKANLTVTINAERTYGDETTMQGGKKEYTGTGATLGTLGVTFSGLKNGESLAQGDLTFNTVQLKDGDSDAFNSGVYLDAGTYTGTATYNGTADKLNGYASSTETSNQVVYVNNFATTGDAKQVNAFNANNYNITMNSTYKVDPKADVTVVIKGEKVYGEDTSNLASNSQYKGEGNGVTITGLKEQVDTDKLTFDITKLNDGDAGNLGKGIHLDVDTYTTANNHGITINNWNDNALANADNGFKASNYAISSTESTYTVTPKHITANIVGGKTYGDATNNAVTETNNQYTTATVGELVSGESVDNKLFTFDISKLKDDDAAAYNSGEYLDVGVYTSPTADSQVDKGITINNWSNLADNTTGFKNKNYVIDSTTSVYTVTPKDVTATIVGGKEYGQETKNLGSDSQYTSIVLNDAHETLGKDKFQLNISNLKDSDDAPYNTDTYLDAGEYTTAGGKGITISNWEGLADASIGFKSSNYNLTGTDSTYRVAQKHVTAHVVGNKVYGDETAANTASSQITSFTIKTLANTETVGNGTFTLTDNMTDGDAGELGKGIHLDVGKYNSTDIATNTGLAINNWGTQENAENGFKASNYVLDGTTSEFEVTPKHITATIEGGKTYGEATNNAITTEKNQYTKAEVKDLVSGESVDNKLFTFDTSKLKDNDAEPYNANKFLDAGTYTSANDKGITIDNWDKLANNDTGFKNKNYVIDSTTSTYKVDPKTITYDLVAARVYGEHTTNQGGTAEYAGNHKDLGDLGVTFYDLENGETVNESTLHFDTSKLVDGDTNPYNKDTYLDAGTYIDKVTIENWESGVGGSAGFHAGNYVISAEGSTSTYVVDKRPVIVVIDKTQGQGEPISPNPQDYNITPEPVKDPSTGEPVPSTGMANDETLDNLGDTTVNIGNPTEVGNYDYEGKGKDDEQGTYTDPFGNSTPSDDVIKGLDFDPALDGKDSPFKPKNYDISYETHFEILPVDQNPLADMSTSINRRGMYSIQYLTIAGNGVTAESTSAAQTASITADTATAAPVQETAPVSETVVTPAVEETKVAEKVAVGTTNTTNLNEALANDTTSAYSADAQEEGKEDEDKKKEKK